MQDTDLWSYIDEAEFLNLAQVADEILLDQEGWEIFVDYVSLDFTLGLAKVFLYHHLNNLHTIGKLNDDDFLTLSKKVNISDETKEKYNKIVNQSLN